MRAIIAASATPRASAGPVVICRLRIGSSQRYAIVSGGLHVIVRTSDSTIINPTQKLGIAMNKVTTNRKA
jgi:hypothetical protein